MTVIRAESIHGIICATFVPAPSVNRNAESRLPRMQTSEVRLRVRYAETDQMGIVYHANYLIWMEMGRVELCRELGIRYRDMEQEDGVLLTVAAANCRFVYPARYDDEI